MKVLIVVDMQNDFITGPLGTTEARAIVSKIREKIDKYIESEDEIIYTVDTHFRNYLDTQEGRKLPIVHCIDHSVGQQIPDELFPNYIHSQIIIKSTFGSIDLQDCLNWFLDGGEVIDSVEIVGVCTDICVVSNALLLKSFYPEIDIFVDATCCAGTTPENHEAGLKVMESCQININR